MKDAKTRKAWIDYACDWYTREGCYGKEDPAGFWALDQTDAEECETLLKRYESQYS